MAINSEYGYFSVEYLTEKLQSMTLARREWLEAGRILLTLRRRLAYRKGKLEEVIIDLNWKGRTARYLIEIAERLDKEEVSPPPGISYRKLGEIICLPLSLKEIFKYAEEMTLDELKEMRKDYDKEKRLKKEWSPPWEYLPAAPDED